MTAATLFGAPLGYEAGSRDRWISVLETTWLAFAHDPPGALDTDLDRLRPLYATGASAKGLRTTFATLEAISVDVDLPQEVALRFEDRTLITPEGRVLLEVLTGMRTNGSFVITETQALWANSTALIARCGWNREWAAKQLEGSLSAPALGAACFLLLNGSIGLNRALTLPDDEAEDRSLGGLVLPLISEFSQRLGGKAPTLDTGLRSHWAFTQVSRLLPLDVGRETKADGTMLFVRKDREQHLVANLRERLARWDVNATESALAGLVTDYRKARGALIAIDQSFEEPRHTQAILAGLLARS